MYRLRTAVLISLAFTNFGFAGASFADAGDSTTQPPVRQSIRDDLQLISDLRGGKLELVARKALDAMVLEGVAVLRENGQESLARQYELSWKNDPRLRQSLDGPARLGILDLGDHAPLSEWLAHFYNTLSEKTRGISKSFRLFSDLDRLNYSLAVVLSPKDPLRKWKNGDDRDYIEYRKHFIPFANIVTYWVSYEGCKSLADQINRSLGMLCDPAASKLEWYMGRHVAWKMSDWIYAKANGTGEVSAESEPRPLEVTEEQLEAACQAE